MQLHGSANTYRVDMTARYSRATISFANIADGGQDFVQLDTTREVAEASAAASTMEAYGRKYENAKKFGRMLAEYQAAYTPPASAAIAPGTALAAKAAVA